MKQFFSAVALAAFCSVSHAAPGMTGNDLLGMCKGADVGSEQPACGMYIMGFLDGDAAGEGIMIGRYNLLDLRYPPYGAEQKVSLSGDWCTTPKVTNGQLIRVIYKYLVDHPTETERSAAVLMHVALATAFPCR